MKIFNGFEQAVQKTTPQRVRQYSKSSHNQKQERIILHNQKSDRVDLSPSAIREKIRAHQLKINKGKPKTLVTLGKDAEETSKVKNNNPEDTNTTEKLKDALRSGAIHFSDKTKQVLGKILKDRE